MHAPECLLMFQIAKSTEDKETVEGSNTVETTEDVSGDTSVAGKHSFVHMVTELPEKISQNMCNNLSVPIAFVCLLHLANEKVSYPAKFNVVCIPLAPAYSTGPI